jgi:hypothetical protein
MYTIYTLHAVRIYLYVLICDQLIYTVFLLVVRVQSTVTMSMRRLQLLVYLINFKIIVIRMNTVQSQRRRELSYKSGIFVAKTNQLKNRSSYLYSGNNL